MVTQEWEPWRPAGADSEFTTTAGSGTVTASDGGYTWVPVEGWLTAVESPKGRGRHVRRSAPYRSPSLPIPRGEWTVAHAEFRALARRHRAAIESAIAEAGLTLDDIASLSMRGRRIRGGWAYVRDRAGRVRAHDGEPVTAGVAVTGRLPR
jgi:hypothetical protein